MRLFIRVFCSAAAFCEINFYFGVSINTAMPAPLVYVPFNSRRECTNPLLLQLIMHAINNAHEIRRHAKPLSRLHEHDYRSALFFSRNCAEHVIRLEKQFLLAFLPILMIIRFNSCVVFADAFLHDFCYFLAISDSL